MEVSGKLHAPTALPPEDILWIGGWVVPRPSLDAVAKRTVPLPLSGIETRFTGWMQDTSGCSCSQDSIYWMCIPFFRSRMLDLLCDVYFFKRFEIAYFCWRVSVWFLRPLIPSCSVTWFGVSNGGHLGIFFWVKGFRVEQTINFCPPCRKDMATWTVQLRDSVLDSKYKFTAPRLTSLSRELSNSNFP